MEAYGSKGLVVLFVITADSGGTPATQDYCTQIRNKYALKTTVICDPDAQMEAYGTNGLAILTDSKAVITFIKAGATKAYLATRIEEALNP